MDPKECDPSCKDSPITRNSHILGGRAILTVQFFREPERGHPCLIRVTVEHTRTILNA